jgi:lysozyme
MSITGIDVSYAQAGLNWAEVATSPVKFGIAKRSEGTAVADPQFEAHWSGIKSAKLVRGAYHFSRWDLETDPTAEAQWFLSHLPALETGDFVVLDIEASPAGVAGYELSPWALTWLVTVERAIGFRPLVYSGYSFAQSYLTDPALSTYGLWVAAYAPECPAPVGPWPMVAMWQHTSQAVYAGHSVDEDYFFGTVDQLRAYGNPTPPSAKGKGGSGPRFLIRVDMMARFAPDLASVLWANGRPQMVYKGAVLDGTGKQTPHWVQVVAGGHPVWVLLANTTPV